MTKRTTSFGMRAFSVIWVGQFMSLVGSNLTAFALGVYVYRITGSVTKFALVSFFTTLPAIVLSPLTGALIDRWDRRSIMIAGDTIAVLGTLSLAALLYMNRLELWHVYVIMSVTAPFSIMQVLAYYASVQQLVPVQHYTRANGMMQFGEAAAQIAAPLIAGALMMFIDIWGVMLIDVIGFVVANSILLKFRFPKPEVSTEGISSKGSLLGEAAYGWRYIKAHPGLMCLLAFFTFRQFNVGAVQVLLSPLVLSFESARVLGTVMAVGGSGMLAGSALMTLWGGPRNRIAAIFGFTVVQGVALFIAALRPNAALIACAAFIFLFSGAIIFACNQAIWLSKVKSDVQGRVFAVRRGISWSAVPLAYLVAGPLVEYLFQPLVDRGGAPAAAIERVVGTGPGRGIALLLLAMGVLSIAGVCAGLLIPVLRNVEENIPDAFGTEVAATT